MRNTITLILYEIDFQFGEDSSLSFFYGVFQKFPTCNYMEFWHYKWLETVQNSPGGKNFVFIFVFLNSPVNFGPEKWYDMYFWIILKNGLLSCSCQFYVYGTLNLVIYIWVLLCTPVVIFLIWVWQQYNLSAYPSLMHWIIRSKWESMPVWIIGPPTERVL